MAWVNGKWVIGPGDYGTYGTYTGQDGNTINLSKEAYDTQMAQGGDVGLAKNWSSSISDWFTPQGPAGTSTGGNLLGTIGTGIGAASGLAGMYYTKKNYDLQKDQQNYLKQREAESDARKRQFAANAGGGASY